MVRGGNLISDGDGDLILFVCCDEIIDLLQLQMQPQLCIQDNFIITFCLSQNEI